MTGPILVGGTGRSGTTLLSRIIGRHPSIFSFRWETQFIVAPGGLIDLIRHQYDDDSLERFLGQLRGRWFRRIMRANTPGEYEAGLCSDISKEDLEFAISLLLRELTSQVTDDTQPARIFLNEIARPAMLRKGASRWSEKTPRNVLYSDSLREVLPGMQMVHIIRDGRDVAASMESNGFWPIGASSDLPELQGFSGDVTAVKAAKYWVKVLDIARSRASTMNASSYLELRFEDLVREPAATLRRLFHFLGEDYDPDLTVTDDIRDRSIGRWKSDLSPQQIKDIHEAIGPSLVAEGYET